MMPARSSQMATLATTSSRQTYNKVCIRRPAIVIEIEISLTAHPSEFWDLGHRLFRTTPETYPVPFVQGDVFNSYFIKPAPPCYETPSTPRPDLKSLPEMKSLTPLQGHVSAISVSLFFHLFPKDGQIHAAKALASLLSPVRGSMIFGTHVSTNDGTSKEFPFTADKTIYGFGVEDWKRLWNGEVFKEGSVRVEAELQRINMSKVYTDSFSQNALDGHQALVWCITRL